jgi:hypothetical protein
VSPRKKGLTTGACVADVMTMFEMVLILLLTAVPWGVGYVSGSYWAALIPGVLLCAAALELARRGASGTDEVDVWPGVLTILCAVAVLLCLAGACFGRVRRR